MRIAYLANQESGNGFYRGIGPMAALAHRGHQVRKLSPDERDPPLAAVRDVDVLLVHRYREPWTLRLVEVAKASGAAVVWDNDDDMGSVPKGTPAYRVHGGVRWEQRLAGMRKIFRHADLVTAPSDALAERLGELGARAHEVIENYVPDDFLGARGAPHDGRRDRLDSRRRAPRSTSTACRSARRWSGCSTSAPRCTSRRSASASACEATATSTSTSSR